MTEAQWERTYHGWVTGPDPDALLHAQVFFDSRPLLGAGEGWEDMTRRVHDTAMGSARGSRRLHTHLAALATFREPPIGFFRGLVVERSGEYARMLDIKRGGTAAVVQMARLYAITAGADEVSDGEGHAFILDQFERALAGRRLLAHFAQMETSFLSQLYADVRGQRYRFRDKDVVDTFALERRHMERMGTYPRGEDLRLARVRERYNLPEYGNHNALIDAIACAELYLAPTAGVNR